MKNGIGRCLATVREMPAGNGSRTTGELGRAEKMKFPAEAIIWAIGFFGKRGTRYRFCLC